VKIWILIIGMIALTTVIVSPATAYRQWGYVSGPGRVEDIAKTPGLNLTTEQAAKINALRETHLKEIKPLLDEMTDKSRKLRGLWLSQQPDQKEIEIIGVEAQKLRLRLMDRVEAYRREVYRELTPDQQQRVQIRDIGQGRGRMGGFGIDRREYMRFPKGEDLRAEPVDGH
jgi:Spy/CpxP family protein refolding chaperone